LLRTKGYVVVVVERDQIQMVICAKDFYWMAHDLAATHASISVIQCSEFSVRQQQINFL
jgi:hypothetical protein